MSLINPNASNPRIDYVSVPTAYYAVGEWRFHRSKSPTTNAWLKRQVYFALFENSVLIQPPSTATTATFKASTSKTAASETHQKEEYTKGADDRFRLFFYGTVKPDDDDKRVIFRADNSFGPDPDANPSQVTSHYTLQARIPNNEAVLRRFPKITNNSGKFLVFVDEHKIDAVWGRFKQAYAEGKLGYGLQCSTAKPNTLKAGSYELISVFTEDSFALNEVTRLAWEIDKLMGPQWRNGTLQYMTDRGTKAKSGRADMNEGAMLYSFPSALFLNSDGSKGSLGDLVCATAYINIDKLQRRKDVLSTKRMDPVLLSPPQIQEISTATDAIKMTFTVSAKLYEIVFRQNSQNALENRLWHIYQRDLNHLINILMTSKTEFLSRDINSIIAQYAFSSHEFNVTAAVAITQRKVRDMQKSL